MAEYEKEAKRAKKEGDYQRAGDLYVMAAKEDLALECYLKGRHYDSAGRLLERMGDYRRAAQYYKMGARYNEAAAMLIKVGEHAKAMRLYEQAEEWAKAKEIAISINDIPLAAYYAEKAQQWEQAAALYAKCGEYTSAARLFEYIVQSMLKEKEEKGYFQSWIAKFQKYAHNTAAIYEMLQQPAKAGFYYTLAENYKSAAEAYLRANRLDKAVENYVRAKDFTSAMHIIKEYPELEPTNPIDFAESCFSTGHYEEAAQYFLKGNDKYRAAESLEKVGHYQEAGDLFIEIQDYEKAAEIYLKGELWEKAANVLESLKNYDYAAQLYLRINKKEDAIRALILGQEYYQASLLLFEIGKKDEAITTLQKVSADHQDYDLACLLLAKEFIELNMPSIAIQKLNEGLEDQPLNKDNIEFYYMLAVAYEQQKDINSALNIYEKILSLDLTYKDVKDKLAALKNKSAKPKEVSLTERFQILEQISSDQTLTIFNAIDTTNNRPIIMKKIPASVWSTSKQYHEVTAKLNHKNIAKVYETLQDNQFTYVCMEYFEGDTLKKRIEESFENFEVVREIAQQLCQALSYAHSNNIVHKNLCPENIYVTKDNLVKITNFDTPLYAMPQISPEYLMNYKAPEQLEGYSLDARADIYSLGIILYEMIYQKYPKLPIEQNKIDEHFPITKWGAPLTEQFKNTIRKCLEADRNNRYNKAEDILEELSLEELCPGIIVAGRYEILQEIGSGGMGKVFKARDRDLEEIVAIKILRSDYAQDNNALNRFIREIKLSRKISHPNVVKVFDIGIHKGHRYISMEYIDGVSLDRIIQQRGALSLIDCLKIALQICMATASAHAIGIVHRDIKPANIMITKNGLVKILDFGIAKAQGVGEITTAGQIIGSPKYMAPEQIQGTGVDTRSDIYSIGLIIYYMATGTEAFTGEDAKSVLMKQLSQEPPAPSSISSSVPKWLDDLILSLLKKGKEERPNSLDIVARKIKNLLEALDLQNK